MASGQDRDHECRDRRAGTGRMNSHSSDLREKCAAFACSGPLFDPGFEGVQDEAHQLG